MLQDELYRMNCMVNELAASDYSGNLCHARISDSFRDSLSTLSREIRAAWNAAAFSDSPDHTLKRYFHYHLDGIREILDTFSFNTGHTVTSGLLKCELTGLISYQLKYFSAYFNYDAVAPAAYLEVVADRSEETLVRVKAQLKNAFFAAALKDCLFAYFGEMDLAADKAGYSYRSLFYFERLILELDGIDLAGSPCQANKRVADTLLGLNFNNLLFLAYCREQISNSFPGDRPAERLVKLKAEHEALKLLPESRFIYDNRWPSFPVMLSQWLSGEIAAAERLLEAEAGACHEKLPLNLSVAQLACLLRLFSGEDLLDSPSLTGIFKFVSGHCQTKRQLVVSAGSLTKEFYSVSQKTAAVVREMLQQMISRINRDFFPVLAAVSVLIGVC